MKKILLLFFVLFSFSENNRAQLPQFNMQVKEELHHVGMAFAIAQDPQGYIWFSSMTKGLIRYDGKEFKTFRSDPENPNSPASNFIYSIAVDSTGKIWLACPGDGIDRFDPATNRFTHFRHNKSDANSLVSDSVFSIMVDHSGKIWLATTKGLQSFDSRSNKFTLIPQGAGDDLPKPGFAVFHLYEDKEGIIWYGTVGEMGLNLDVGGLIRLDPNTGKQTFYKADKQNPECLINASVTAIFEDSRGTFWVGTGGNGLHTLDRKTGKFTRHLYDPAQPGKLSRPPIGKTDTTDGISFIGEDHLGKIWIGSFSTGINWFDPVKKQTFHFGLANNTKSGNLFEKDTSTGFKDQGVLRFMTAADGSTWFTGIPANIYTVSYGKKAIPYYPYNHAVNAFYFEPDANILWFGTDSGLVRKDLNTNTVRIWKHDPGNSNSLNHNSVVAIQADENGKLYIGAHAGGLDLFDPATGIFRHIKPGNTTAGKTLDSLHCIFIENERSLWLGGEMGLARVDRANYQYTVFRFDKENEEGISGNTVFSIAKDKEQNLWFANVGGLDKFISKSNSFRHYLKGYVVRAVLVDAKGILWAGTDIGLFQYNKAKDQFVPFSSPVFSDGIESILNILEDDGQNLWITTANAILKMNADRQQVQMFNADYGILSSNWNWLNNYKAANGLLFIGGSKGYYMFRPEEINVSNPAPVLNFSQFLVGGKEVLPDKNGILSDPIWKTTQINLAYNQNTFSVDFIALNFNSSTDIKYSYQLEHFDKIWNNLGTDHKASFFNVPPGLYKLRVRAMNSEGTISEKTLSILVSPPWWKTWWAYSFYALLMILMGYLVYKYQKFYIVKKERERSQQRELAQAREIEKAYNQLKQTQAQLIQSEKMASLGELTAGIAHEIQNPLNFVNNFSEVSLELIDELKSERAKMRRPELAEGRRPELAEGESERNEALEAELLKDIAQNLEKINHHGKRADSIVKGMLQHSRMSTGQKEATDINALCDEYLRLAYHGLKARDKSFEASFHFEPDSTITKVNVVTQDIGRVLLNLINNAFQAVSERVKRETANVKEKIDGASDFTSQFLPLVTVSTKKLGDKIEISVKDNGSGIPKAIKDKIFQPFFTTKPSGEGTGLGLSLSYDIVKAHGGEISVITKEGSGSTFIILLPA